MTSHGPGQNREEIQRYHLEGDGWMDRVKECPVYHPSAEEFADPIRYIRSIQAEASKHGICKIVPPLKCKIPAGLVLRGLDVTAEPQQALKFRARRQEIKPAAAGDKEGKKFQYSHNTYTLQKFEKMARDKFTERFGCSAALPEEHLEAEFWRVLEQGVYNARTGDKRSAFRVEYGNDVEGTGFSRSGLDPLGSSAWNLTALPMEPESTFSLLSPSSAIPGVKEPMLYVGMLFSQFAWHVEDHYLYSINFHHMGAPKTWYGVPAEDALKFEKAASQHIFDATGDAEMLTAANALMNKTTMISPKVLMAGGARVCRAYQQAGEYVVTFPRAYHGGFSNGFNCGEAVNFAMREWFMFGEAARLRYRQLEKRQIIPHEEILCKDALAMACGAAAGADGGAPMAFDKIDTAFQFVSLVMRTKSTLLGLQAKGLALASQPEVGEAWPCYRCFDPKYLCSVLETSAADPSRVVCLRCFCAGDCDIADGVGLVRDNFKAMETRAKDDLLPALAEFERTRTSSSYMSGYDTVFEETLNALKDDSSFAKSNWDVEVLGGFKDLKRLLRAVNEGEADLRESAFREACQKVWDTDLEWNAGDPPGSFVMPPAMKALPHKVRKPPSPPPEAAPGEKRPAAQEAAQKKPKRSGSFSESYPLAGQLVPSNRMLRKVMEYPFEAWAGGNGAKGKAHTIHVLASGDKASRLVTARDFLVPVFQCQESEVDGIVERCFRDAASADPDGNLPGRARVFPAGGRDGDPEDYGPPEQYVLCRRECHALLEVEGAAWAGARRAHALATIAALFAKTQAGYYVVGDAAPEMSAPKCGSRHNNEVVASKEHAAATAPNGAQPSTSAPAGTAVMEGMERPDQELQDGDRAGEHPPVAAPSAAVPMDTAPPPQPQGEGGSPPEAVGAAGTAAADGGGAPGLQGAGVAPGPQSAFSPFAWRNERRGPAVT